MRVLTSFIFVAFLHTLPSGSFAQQVCQSGLAMSAPDGRYVVQTDTSQVKDTRTGLIWQRCSSGQTWSGNACTGSARLMTWQTVLTLAGTAGSSNGFAWRVPSFKELTTLAELGCWSPAINVTFFPTTPEAGHWTSTSLASNPSQAWFVMFSLAGEYYDAKTNFHYVRFVRSSQ